MAICGGESITTIGLAVLAQCQSVQDMPEDRQTEYSVRVHCILQHRLIFYTTVYTRL